MSRYGVSCSVGRDRDRRYRLSEQQIEDLRTYVARGGSKASIARKFGVHYNTVRYYTDPAYRAKQMEKNAKRTRTPAEEKVQTKEKQRRRNLVRESVRVYTRLQMRALREQKAAHYRKYGRLYARRWRAKNRARVREIQRRAYWRRKERTGV